MSKINKNIISNFVMQAILLLTQLGLLPFYIKYFGIESYALIGLYIALQAVFVFFDLGMSTTINQVLANQMGKNEKNVQAINVLYTFEKVYWAIGIIIFCIIYFILPWITSHWIGHGAYSVYELKSNLIFISLLVVIRFPLSFYVGAMNGLQKQYTMNVVLIVSEILKFAIIIILVLFVSKNVSIYFLVNIFLIILVLFVLRNIIYRSLGANIKGKFNIAIIKENWKFSLGVSFVSLFAILISQADKFILGKMVSIEQFSYYALAFTIASLPSKIYCSIASAFYPALVTCKSQQDQEKLISTYHKANQMISILTIPIVLAALFFTPQLLNLWFGDIERVAILTPLVRFLLVGFTMNGFLLMPYYLQLVHQWTSLLILKNVVAFILLFPLQYYAIKNFGAIGASWIYCLLFVLFLIFEIPIMHSRILVKEMNYFYLKDIGIFVGISFVVSSIMFLLAQYFDLSLMGIIILCIIFIPSQIILLNKLSSEQPLLSFINLDFFKFCGFKNKENNKPMLSK